MPVNPAVFNRTRSRNLWDTIDCYVDDARGGVYNFPTAIPVAIETISDVVGEPQVSRRFISKPTYHTKVAYVPRQSRLLQGASWAPNGYRTRPAPLITQGNIDSMVSWNPPISLIDEQGFAQKAFDQFGDQFPAAVDLGNFLYEWKGVVDLAPKFERELSNTVSSAHLNWSFGWSPMIGDLEKLFSIVNVVLDRIAWLRAHNHRKSRLRLRRRIDGTPAIKPSMSLGNPAFALHWPDMLYSAALAKLNIEHVATCQLQMDIDIPEDLEAVARGLVAALGLNNPLGTLYNSSPFTFVVDWIWKFGDVLDRHKYKTYIGQYEVTDFTYSLKETREWDVHYVYKAIAPEVDVSSMTYAEWTYRYTADTIIGTVRDERYHRDVGWTQTEWPALSFPPSAGSAILATSLLRSLT